MSIDYSKHKLGDILSMHVCNDCQYRQTKSIKSPADSGVESWYCEVCGHFNIGSKCRVQIGNWLSLNVVKDQSTSSEGDRYHSLGLHS